MRLHRRVRACACVRAHAFMRACACACVQRACVWMYYVVCACVRAGMYARASIRPSVHACTPVRACAPDSGLAAKQRQPHLRVPVPPEHSPAKPLCAQAPPARLRALRPAANIAVPAMAMRQPRRHRAPTLHTVNTTRAGKLPLMVRTTQHYLAPNPGAA